MSQVITNNPTNIEVLWEVWLFFCTVIAAFAELQLIAVEQRELLFCPGNVHVGYKSTSAAYSSNSNR